MGATRTTVWIGPHQSDFRPGADVGTVVILPLWCSQSSHYGGLSTNFSRFGQSRAPECADESMIPKNKQRSRKDDPEGPLENQPLEWAEEDREIEDREPDLGESEEDTSEL
jgi:hypothetical protein